MSGLRRVIGGVLLVGGLATTATCASSGPTSDERAVCDTLQQLVDHLESGASSDAVETMYQLDQSVSLTTNSTLASAGRHFFEVISQPVDVGSMTAPQSAALGDQVLAAAEPELATLLDTCSSIGLAVEVRPRSGDDGR